jgi:broad-specificity NMP kinase
MSIEAMKQALDALSYVMSHGAQVQIAKDILIEAIEQAEHVHAVNTSQERVDETAERKPDLASVGEVGVWGEREWVGLTDEEVSEVIDDVLEGGGWLDVARALEAAIKEKNRD